MKKNEITNNVEVWNNPELEAKVVAMLMGELSAFEQSELEDALEKSPELRLFRDKMEKVVGLVNEVHEEGENAEWKMSGEKREALLETLSGADQVEAEENVVSTAAFQWRNAAAVAACLLMSFIAVAVMFVKRTFDVTKSNEGLVSYAPKSEDGFLDASNLRGGIDMRGETSVTMQVESKSVREMPLEEDIVWAEEDPGLNGKIEEFKEIERKPSLPSSSMARVIAANSPSAVAVPVPDVSMIEPSLDFGDGDDFGDGWGEGKKASAVASRLRDKPSIKLLSKFVEINQSNTDELGFGWVSDASEKVDLANQNGRFKSNKILGGNNAVTNGNDASYFYNDGQLYKEEILRRKINVKSSDNQLIAGREAYSKGNYEEAVKNYKKALHGLPQGPIAAERKESYTGHLVDGSVALAQQYRRTGRYDEARDLLNQALTLDSNNALVKKQLEYLDDPIRTSPTLTHEHSKNVEKVRKSLYKGESYYNEAQFENAIAEYKEVLRVDPYNKAARRGMEKVNVAKSDYYRAAYDETRSQMLKDVDRAWEQAVPPTIAKDAEMSESRMSIADNDKQGNTQTRVEDAARKVSLMEIVLNNPSLTEMSGELFGTGFGEINKSSLEKAKKELQLAENGASGGQAIPSARGQIVKISDRESNVHHLQEMELAQQAKVEEQRKRLYDLSERLNKPYYGLTTGENRKKTVKANSMDVAKQSRDELAIISGAISKLKNEDLVSTLSKIDRSETKIIKDKLKEVSRLSDEIAALKAQGLANGHPKLKVLQTQKDTSNDYVKNVAPIIKSKINSDLATMNKRIDALRKVKRNEDSVDRSASNKSETEFSEIRDEYEKEMRKLEEIKKMAAEVKTDGRRENKALAVRKKLRNNQLDSLSFSEDTTVAQALEILKQKSGDAGLGLKIDLRDRLSVPDVDGLAVEEEFLSSGKIGDIKLGGLKLRNVPADEALRQICEATGLRYKVENGGVVLMRATDLDDTELYTRIFRVPADFENMLKANEGDSSGDPFDDGEMDYSKMGTKELLEATGIPFPYGSSVVYSKEKGVISVRNTANNLDLIELITSKVSLAAERKVLDMSKETSAAEQTHSTFSLNVSDVSFKLAMVEMLENNRLPDPAKIRVEEFVNAFDYGDPSAADKKVSAVVEQCAHPFIQQRNLMRIGMKTGAVGRSQPLQLIVLLDNSGSMEREDRAATVLKAMEALASKLGPEDEVTLMSFARDARLVAQKLKGNEAGQLVELVRAIPSEGGTNLSKSIQQAYAVAKRDLKPGRMSRIVLMTDGAANLGNAKPAELTDMVVSMRQNGIAFDACGVGADGLNDEILEALTRKGDGRYYFINRPQDADAQFAEKLAGALRPAAKNVKVQVVFNPNRVGNYRLLGFEKHRLEKEDFRNDAVDAAEMAAEEAGNALYQVEAKANGHGNVGTVFVRFRDMESGQMVERSWEIPYEPSIQQIDGDSIPSSLKLASVAGMLAEKLKFGEASGVDFDQLKPVLNELRVKYANDEKVKKLILMCELVDELTS